MRIIMASNNQFGNVSSFQFFEQLEKNWHKYLYTSSIAVKAFSPGEKCFVCNFLCSQGLGFLAQFIISIAHFSSRSRIDLLTLFICLFEFSSRSLIIFNLDFELFGISTNSVYGFFKESNCLDFP
jgi:hypothetical protein